MKVTIKPYRVTPKGFDPVPYKRAIENAGTMSSKAVQVDFKVTTRTWEHQPAFTIKHPPRAPEWTISTTDKIYGYVSMGTKPHVILPKNAPRLVFFRTGFSPKSRVAQIRSYVGRKAKKNKTFAKRVFHPGNEARRFAETIHKKWEQEWPRQVERALRAVAQFPR